MVTTAVILAAGKGTKLFPYCDTWQKAALPLANSPLIRWQIDALKQCGIKRFIVVTSHFGGQVRDALSSVEQVEYREQSVPDGTANALKLVLPKISNDAFLVVYGDTVFEPQDIKTVLDVYQEKKQAVALVQNLGSLSSQDWLCANLRDHKIKDILGHPREASHRLCGIYALDKKIIPYLEQNPGLMTSVEVGNMPPVEADLAESLSQYIKRGNPVSAVECQGIFDDIDKPWHYLDANDRWLKHVCSSIQENNIAESASVSPHAEIQGNIVVGENSVLGADVKIKGIVIRGNNT